MRKIAFLLVLLLFFVPLTQAQQLSSHRNTVSGAYNFWLFTPEGYDTCSSGKPLIIFLHGRSLCGHDLNRVRRYGPLNAIDMGMRIDAIILAPQNPGGGWKPEKVMKLMEWVEDRYKVDTNRVYVLGMSLGGYGTIDFAGTYPDRIAAAMALCGGGTLKDYCGLNNLPLWILHGTADRSVGISASQRVVDAMGDCGESSRLIWTRLQGMNHGQLARIFYLPETYEWLFAHSLADTNRPVDRSFTISPSTLTRDAYRAARQGGKVSVVACDDAGGKADTVGNAPQAEPARKYHTIKKGDTLGALARKYHTSVRALCRLNNISETTTLRIGRRLRVK